MHVEWITDVEVDPTIATWVSWKAGKRLSIEEWIAVARLDIM